MAVECEHDMIIKRVRYMGHNLGFDEYVDYDVGCDQCHRVLGCSVYCWHCVGCEKWDVCFKCRPPSVEELKEAKLPNFFFISQLPLLDRIVLMETSNDRQELEVLLSAKTEILSAKQLRTDYLKIVEQDEYIKLLS